MPRQRSAPGAAPPGTRRAEAKPRGQKPPRLHRAAPRDPGTCGNCDFHRAGAGESPPPPALPSPHPLPVRATPGGAPRGVRAALCEPVPREGGAGEGRARRLFASTRKHQQSDGGRIRGGGGDSEIGRPSGPGSHYRAGRLLRLVGASLRSPAAEGSSSRPRCAGGSRCRARRGGPDGAGRGLRRRLGAGARRAGVAAGGRSHDRRGGRAGV